ncbi:MAG: flagellar basal body P-ring formation chaperone FlgA [Gemmatimonadota bacterium]
MISFGSWLLLMLPAMIQSPELTRAPSSLRERVAVQVAQSWRVDPASIRFEWSTVAPDTASLDSTDFRVSGSGTDGWLVLILNSDSAATRAFRFRAGSVTPTMVASRPLSSGTTLGPDDLRTELRVHWGPPATVTSTPSEGWELRRAFAEGEVIREPSAVPPSLIAAGSPVQVVWSRGNVHLTVNGTAMNAARLGQSVRVRVDGRTGRLVAIATAAGVVTLSE